MTLGQAPEALAIGYLRNQRLVSSLDELAAVQVDWETDAVAVTTRRGVKSLAKKLAKRTVTTGCGQGTMFGDLMEEVDSIRLRDDVRLPEASLFAVLEAVRQQETVYNSAGAVHGCALASNEGADSRILIFVEDVGRHNAVDAIAGRMWLDGIDGSDKIFYTTGRLTSEMVIKAAQMGIPVLVSRSGLTEMGRIATRVGMTMIGRAAGKHFLLFTGRTASRPRAHRERGYLWARARRWTGTPHGGRRQGLAAIARSSLHAACDRPPAPAGRQRADQCQPEPRALCRVRLSGCARSDWRVWGPWRDWMRACTRRTHP